MLFSPDIVSQTAITGLDKGKTKKGVGEDGRWTTWDGRTYAHTENNRQWTNASARQENNKRCVHTGLFVLGPGSGVKRIYSDVSSRGLAGILWLTSVNGRQRDVAV